MSFWVVLRNIGVVIEFFKILARVIKDVAQGRKLPECSAAADLIDAAIRLLEKKVIDIPGVDEDAVLAALIQIKGNFTCKVK